MVDDVTAHLENLISILSNYENYHLSITKMVVPFVVVTYDIRSGALAESFTVFILKRTTTNGAEVDRVVRALGEDCL